MNITQDQHASTLIKLS